MKGCVDWYLVFLQWNFKRLEDGTFPLTLDGSPQSFVQDMSGKLVANNSSPGPFKAKANGDTYTLVHACLFLYSMLLLTFKVKYDRIQIFDNAVPPTVWTVNDSHDTNSHVRYSHQKWIIDALTFRALGPHIPEQQEWYILSDLVWWRSPAAQDDLTRKLLILCCEVSDRHRCDTQLSYIDWNGMEFVAYRL